MSRKTDIPALSDALRSGDRRALARAITLVESGRTDHRAEALALVLALALAIAIALVIALALAPSPQPSPPRQCAQLRCCCVARAHVS